MREGPPEDRGVLRNRLCSPWGHRLNCGASLRPITSENIAPETDMATIIPKLFNIYRAAGYEPITGYSPFHFFNLRDVPFTVFLKHNTISGCPGLALQEIMFVEQFRDFIAPQRVLIIGNAYGWSTIALALTFPSAKIVAIDPDIAKRSSRERPRGWP
jgi:hypothetical protein